MKCQNNVLKPVLLTKYAVRFQLDFSAAPDARIDIIYVATKLTGLPSPSKFSNSVNAQKISTATWVVLLGTLAVIVLIVVLPQVDLLDTAFHRNTSPLSIRARVNSPAFSVLTNFLAGWNPLLPQSASSVRNGESGGTGTAQDLITLLDVTIRV